MLENDRNIITNKIILPETGRPLKEWFVELDNVNAASMSHAGIFALTARIKGRIT